MRFVRWINFSRQSVDRLQASSHALASREKPYELHTDHVSRSYATLPSYHISWSTECGGLSHLLASAA